jgi:type I restriction enzyme M protein
MSTITTDIVARLWNLCNILKDDGVTYHQYVTELTYLLFLKMAKETGAEDAIPSGHRWDDLEAKPAPNRLEAYKLTLIHPRQPRLAPRAGNLRQRQLLHQETGYALYAGS